MGSKPSNRPSDDGTFLASSKNRRYNPQLRRLLLRGLRLIRSEVPISVTFSIDRPDSATALALIEELDADLGSRYPGEWIHGLHPEDVGDPGLVFVVMHSENQAIGCGALRPLDAEMTEVKRMYVKSAFRGFGYARKLLEFLESTARTTGYKVVRLETGTEQPEAIGLYESSGYHSIPAYGEYVGNPFSLCYEKKL
jgi:putative acetyltransferase